MLRWFLCSKLCGIVYTYAYTCLYIYLCGVYCVKQGARTHKTEWNKDGEEEGTNLRARAGRTTGLLKSTANDRSGINVPIFLVGRFSYLYLFIWSSGTHAQSAKAFHIWCRVGQKKTRWRKGNHIFQLLDLRGEYSLHAFCIFTMPVRTCGYLIFPALSWTQEPLEPLCIRAEGLCGFFCGSTHFDTQAIDARCSPLKCGAKSICNPFAPHVKRFGTENVPPGEVFE